MIIHQALHGYSQGHNRLASSLSLSLQDDDRMKMLSDWSEYSVNNDNSYITTYPLSDGKHYVVAKSWYADEIGRPGCVWTHSLIIDLTSLDEKFDFRTLSFLFKRPANGEYSSYSEVIQYMPEVDAIGHTFAEDVLIWLYVNLVNQDTHMLYRVEMESSYYQNIILVLLQYLPLGILKNIAMCSGSAFGRRQNSIVYNLQFAVSCGESLSVMVKDSKDAINGVCEGVKSICRSMIRESSDTDEVLRLFSNDIGNSPLKLCGVGLLLKYLDDAIARLDNTPSFSKVLGLLLDTFSFKDEGTNVKNTFCRKSISNLFSPEYIVLADIAIAIPDGWMDFENIDYPERVISLKIDAGIDEFVKYLILLIDADKLNAEGEFVLKNSDKYLNLIDYNSIAKNHWALYMSLVMANPGILKYSFWIDLPEELFTAAYDVFRKHCLVDFDAWDRLFMIVLYRNHIINETLMSCFVKHVANITYAVMNYLNTSDEGKLNPLLRDYCIDHVGDILSWLRMQNDLTPSVKTFLIDYVNPASKIVRNSGSDVWTTLMQSTHYKQSAYYVFFFILGHNWTDANSLQFIIHSFYPIHLVLSKSMMPDELWRKIEPYTAKLNIFKEWDKCKKLRKGTICYLKSSGYSKSVLQNFTPDENLNRYLQEIWDKE